MVDAAQMTIAAMPRPSRHRSQPYATGIAGVADGGSRLGWGEGGAERTPFARGPARAELSRDMREREKRISEGI